MGRPQIDPSARRLNVQLAPPADLSPAKRTLWEREFGRMPPGYFVPSDLRGLLLYLDAVVMYEFYRGELQAAIVAKTPLDKGLRRDFLEAQKMVARLQKDLRMYPSTRTHREIHGTLANDPARQAAQPGEATGKDAWRGLFPVTQLTANQPHKAPAKKARGRK